jgi:DNA polymerase III epsilon subunit-like protein
MTHALIVDTETSGLFDYRKAAHEEGQPYLASISAILLDDGGAEVRSMHRLIKPTEAWGESALRDLKQGLGAFAINGLTHDQLMSEGVPVEEVLAEYDALTDSCGGVAAFNVSYDQKVIRGAYRRVGKPDRYGERPTFCVMRGSGALLKQRGVKLGKVPNLGEAVRHLLDREHGEAHKAVADTIAAADLYRLLLAEGLVEWRPQIPEERAE